MQDMHLDELLIPLPCPDCGMEFEKTISWIRHNSKHWCQHCHVEVDLSHEKFREGVKSVEKAIAELQKAIVDLELSVKY